MKKCVSGATRSCHQYVFFLCQCCVTVCCSSASHCSQFIVSIFSMHSVIVNAKIGMQVAAETTVLDSPLGVATFAALSVLQPEI